MRNIRLFFFVGIVLFLGGQSLYSQSKKERKEQKAKEIKEMIENGRFTIEVDRAFLQKMIALRNKTFHGEGKDLQEYIQAGPELLYLCEMILEAVRKGM